jgi:outer membrane protein assembly factor BamD (BamD/ComL family)
MNSYTWSSILLGIGLLFASCSSDPIPTEILKQAKWANKNQEYEKAERLYQQLLNLVGEEQVTEDLQFKATLGHIESKIGKKDYDGALKNIKRLREAFGEKVGIGKYTRFIQALVESKAVSTAVDVLSYLKDTFPEEKKLLKELAEYIKEVGMSPEEKERLKLSY